jgi:mannitol-specific phosphotransferase system IIBC component
VVALLLVKNKGLFMPALIGFAAALSVSVAALFASSPQHNNDNVDASAQQQTQSSTKASAEINAETTAQSTNQSNTTASQSSNASTNIALPDVDGTYDFSTINTLHTVFDANAETAISGSVNVSE